MAGLGRGVYRLWRDAGYALGAVPVGVLADKFGLTAAVWAIAALTAASELVAAAPMYETHHRATPASAISGVGRPTRRPGR